MVLSLHRFISEIAELTIFPTCPDCDGARVVRNGRGEMQCPACLGTGAALISSSFALDGQNFNVRFAPDQNPTDQVPTVGRGDMAMIGAEVGMLAASAAGAADGQATGRFNVAFPDGLVTYAMSVSRV